MPQLGCSVAVVAKVVGDIKTIVSDRTSVYSLKRSSHIVANAMEHVLCLAPLAGVRNWLSKGCGVAWYDLLKSMNYTEAGAKQEKRSDV
jgi:hypothetical protein